MKKSEAVPATVNPVTLERDHSSELLATVPIAIGMGRPSKLGEPGDLPNKFYNKAFGS